MNRYSKLLDKNGRPMALSAGLDADKTNRATRGLPSIAQSFHDMLGESELERVRARIRHMAWNDDSLMGIIDKLVKDITVGINLVIKIHNRDGTTNGPLTETVERILKKAWRHDYKGVDGFGHDNSSFKECMKLLVRTFFVDGEVGLLPVIEKRRDRVLPRAWQITNGDSFASAYNIENDLREGRLIDSGVEHDDNGRVIAYWLKAEQKNAYSFAKAKRITVDKGFIHWFTKTMVGQYRGFSQFAALVRSLRSVGFVAEAKIIAEWLANSLAVILETKVDGPTSDNPWRDIMGANGQTSSDSDSKVEPYTADIISGQMQSIPPEYEAKVVDPNRPGGDIGGFMRAYFMKMAGATGMAFEDAFADYSQTNFSAGRMSRQRTEFSIANTMDSLEDIAEEIGRDAMEQIINVKRYITMPAGASYSIKLRHKTPDWLDPVDEATANAMDMASGTRSPLKIIEQRGDDPADVLDEMVRWQQMVKDRNIEMDASVFPWLAIAGAAQKIESRSRQEGQNA